MIPFRKCCSIFLLFLCASAAAYSSDSFREPAKNHNLVSQASGVLSSGTSTHHGPRQAADGLLGTYWDVDGTADAPGWIEFTWKQPVTVQELVVRRYEPSTGVRDLTHLKVEGFENGAWHEIATIGNGKEALPRIIYDRFPVQVTEKVRVSGFDTKAQIREIGLYSDKTPPFMDVRGDDRGNIIGVLTDGFGSKGLAAVVRATGRAGGKAWHESAKTGQFGEFTMPRPVGLTGKVEFTAKVDGETVRKVVDAGDILEGLTPRAGNILELDGTWKFMPDPPQGFQRTDFDDSAWKPIKVPAHWVMQGFTSVKKYGGYRRHVVLPDDWKGQRIRIAFDGVYSGAVVWWNGQRVGSHMGGATSFQLDVTAAAHPGDNVIAVRVAKNTVTSQLDHMSMYADFSLAGIYRRAYVFRVPPVHVQRAQSYSTFDPEFKNADLITQISVVNQSGRAAHHLSLQLILMDGKQVTAQSRPVELNLRPWSRQKETIQMKVVDPRKWNAEHPELYTLRTVLTRGDGTVERLEKKIGFRETRVEGTKLMIDGKSIKLMGVDHHDSDPLLGRAVTPAIERQDLDLMKEANVDAVRTTHYPPIPEFDDLADKIGLYVEEEAPFCWVDQSYDLRLGALTRQLTSEMVERDMSNPAVTYWSAGNESDWGPILDEGADEIRSHDPSRPVMGSYADHLDFTVRHNPITVDQIHALANNSKPVLWDESMAIFQGIFGGGPLLWRDPGYRNYWVVPMIPVMKAIRQSKVVQGNFIWAWVDDQFLVPNRGDEHGRGFVERDGLERIYYKKGRGRVGDAPWGIVDGWRRKKPEFWNVKKLYSPIHVEARKLAMPSSSTVQIPIENRYYFTNLSDLTIEWQIDGQKGTVKANLPPQTSGNLEIPLPAKVNPGDHLVLRFLKGGNLVDVDAIQLGEAPKAVVKPEHHAPLQIHRQELLSGVTPRIDGGDFSLGISGRRGLIQYFVSAGIPILDDQPQIHVLPMRSPVSFPATNHWTLDRPLDITESNGTITLVSYGHYPDLKGSYKTVLTPDGDVTISSDFVYTGPKVSATEIGMKIEVPLELDHLSWKRKGVWTWYPSDDIGALTGSVTAHSGKPGFVIPTWPYSEDDSPMGSNMYRSTKRGLLSAKVTNATGQGWEILSDGSQSLRASVGTNHITVYVNDYYGGAPDDLYEFLVNYGDGKTLNSGDHLRSVLRLHRLKGKQDSH